MLLDSLRRLSLSLPLLVLGGCPNETPAEVPQEGSSGGSTTTGPMQPTATGVITNGPSTGIADDTGSGGPSDGSCCSAHPEAGCDDPDVATCVCRQEASCCAFAWAEACADMAVQDCGGCETATTTGETTTTGEPPEGACCEPSMMPGCSDAPGIERCVCAQDDFCCNEAWDGMCVDQAHNDCGAQCQVGSGGDCCAGNGSTGCDDPMITQCTCELDPYCCDEEWDGLCVSEAHYGCDGMCGLPPANQEDCCTATDGPGCDDMMMTECTCMLDNQCCLVSWTNECIQQGVNACDLMCEGFEPQPPCCQVQMGPGCGDMDIEDCVCAFDDFCCNMQWDGVCVDEAQNACMLECIVGPAMGGGA